MDYISKSIHPNNNYQTKYTIFLGNSNFLGSVRKSLYGVDNSKGNECVVTLNSNFAILMNCPQ